MIIRKIHVEELPQLVALCREHAAFERASPPACSVASLNRAIFSSNPALWVWVLVDGVELQGFMSVSREFSTWSGQYFLHLDCLYLRAQVRGQGYGRRLMETLRQDSRLGTYQQIQWQTPVWNEPAIRFYLHVGAKALEKLRFYWEVV